MGHPERQSRNFICFWIDILNVAIIQCVFPQIHCSVMRERPLVFGLTPKPDLEAGPRLPHPIFTWRIAPATIFSLCSVMRSTIVPP